MRPSLPLPPGGVAPRGGSPGGVGGRESPGEVGSDDKTEAFPAAGEALGKSFEKPRKQRQNQEENRLVSLSLFGLNHNGWAFQVPCRKSLLRRDFCAAA